MPVYLYSIHESNSDLDSSDFFVTESDGVNMSLF